MILLVRTNFFVAGLVRTKNFVVGLVRTKNFVVGPPPRTQHTMWKKKGEKNYLIIITFILPRAYPRKQGG